MLEILSTPFQDFFLKAKKDVQEKMQPIEAELQKKPSPERKKELEAQKAKLLPAYTLLQGPIDEYMKSCFPDLAFYSQRRIGQIDEALKKTKDASQKKDLQKEKEKLKQSLEKFDSFSPRKVGAGPSTNAQIEEYNRLLNTYYVDPVKQHILESFAATQDKKNYELFEALFQVVKIQAAINHLYPNGYPEKAKDLKEKIEYFERVWYLNHSIMNAWDKLKRIQGKDGFINPQNSSNFQELHYTFIEMFRVRLQELQRLIDPFERAFEQKHQANMESLENSQKESSKEELERLKLQRNGPRKILSKLEGYFKQMLNITAGRNETVTEQQQPVSISVRQQLSLEPFQIAKPAQLKIVTPKIAASYVAQVERLATLVLKAGERTQEFIKAMQESEFNTQKKAIEVECVKFSTLCDEMNTHKILLYTAS
jgi:hypothetical protein